MFPNLTGGLSSILSSVPFPGKMTIIPIMEKGGLPIPIGAPYIVQFNPETLTEEVKYCYSSPQPQGKEGTEQRWNKKLPPSFQLEFLIDGTGASGDKRDVSAEIELFQQILAVKSATHRPPLLLLVYGTFFAKCVLGNMTTKYTLFRKNGSPLRASINCTFYGHVSKVLDLLKMNLLSPDLTHERMVVEGDTLPNLCNAIYDSPRFYIEVAKANGLTSIRSIRPSEDLIFPPVDK